MEGKGINVQRSTLNAQRSRKSQAASPHLEVERWKLNVGSCDRPRQSALTLTLSPRERGSTLLLVLAALLLSLILGLMYLEVVRLDRRSTRPPEDIESIVQAVEDLARARIASDLGINNNNQYFAASDGENAGGAAEPFDYPGDLDQWLATFDPELDGPYATASQAKFAQVSNIGQPGTLAAVSPFLTPDAGDPDLLLVAPELRAHIARSAVTVGKRYIDPADADGDGITDSRPQRAPIPEVNGIRYYMWVRIIDNSAMLNLNIATAQGGPGYAYNVENNSPRWWYPSELDLSGFISSSPNFNAAETEDLFRLRLNLPTGSNSGPAQVYPTLWANLSATEPRRQSYWGEIASKYGQNYVSYPNLSLDPLHEAELRWRNGLAREQAFTNVTPVGLLPNVLRSAAKEMTYTQALTNLGAASGSPAGNIGQYFDLEPRHQLTTRSGHSIFTPSLTTNAGEIKPDLNVLCANPADLEQHLLAIFNQAPATFVTADGKNAADYARQLAANIADYYDADNQLTTYNDSAGNQRFGLEALPFITEAYVQHAYTRAGTPPVPPLNASVVIYQKHPTTGVAIELRNPFSTPANLQGVTLYIAGAPIGAGDLTAIPGIPAALGPGEAVVIYQNSADGSGNNNLNAALPTTAVLFPGPVTAFDAGLGATVELRATAQGGLNVVYQRVAVQPYVAPPIFTPTPPQVAVGTIPVQYDHFRIQATIGDGRGLQPITLRENEFAMHTHPNPDVPPGTPAPYPAGGPIHALGFDDKTGKNGAVGKLTNIPANQIGFRDGTPIREVGELAMIPAIGPYGVPSQNPTLPLTIRTVADAWNERTVGAGSADNLYLNLDGAVIAALGLTPGQVLLNSVTTLSPADDGIDNDPAVDDADEMFIPGTINLSTAPYYVLANALPIANGILREEVARAIIEYRKNQNPGSRPNLHRAELGFASVGEFYNLPIDPAVLHYGNDGPNINNLGDTWVDFYPDDPATGNGVAGNDGFSDDIEERTMIGRWLGQVGSVRSDVFTVYILVRGYRGNSVTPESQIRRMVVFDRSKMMQQGDVPQVVAKIRKVE